MGIDNRFFIRKLKFGVASFLVCMSFLSLNSELRAEEINATSKSQFKINYLSVDEKDLSSIEKKLVIKDNISKERVSEDDIYVVVYKNKDEIKSILPDTGISRNIFNLLLAGSFLVLVYKLRRKKGTLIGITVLVTSGLGLNHILAEESINFISNQVKIYEKTNNLEKLNIENYEYVGYIRDEEIPKNTRLYRVLENYKLDKSIIKDNKGNFNEDKSDLSNEKTSDLLNEENSEKTDEKTSDKLFENEKTETKVPNTKITLEEIPFKTVYLPDNSLEYGNVKENGGENGVKEVKLIYVLNKTTGKIETTQEISVIKEPVNKIVTKGTKEKIDEVVVNFETIYEEDSNLYVGTEEVIDGVNGLKRVRTTYTLDTSTGLVTSNSTEEILKEVKNKVVKRGTKPLEKEAPTINITTFDEINATNNTIILDSDLDNRLEVGLSYTNENSITKKKYRLYKDNVLVSENDFSSELNLSNLEHDVAYRLEAIVEYNSNDGNKEIKDSKDFILELKKIEIKDIKEHRIFKKLDNRVVRILNFDSIPSDLDDYYVEIISDVNKPILLPITKVEDLGDKFKIFSDFTDLVEKRENIYQKGYDFEITKLNKTDDKIYSFKQLLDDIKTNPSGEFVLGSSITASDVSLETSTYIDNFSGTIRGNGNAIYDLTKPLFNTLENANIENLELKDVNIYTIERNRGSLSNVAINSTITNVDVSGNIVANGTLGGLVATSNNSNYSDVSFKGMIKNIHSALDRKDNFIVGGIVGYANSITLDKAYVDANLQISGKWKGSKAGGLLGQAKNKFNVTNVTVKGNLINRGANEVQAGGLVGSLWEINGILADSVSLMKVKNGNILYGDKGDNRQTRFRNVSTVDGVSSGDDYSLPYNKISLEDAISKEKEQAVTLPEHSLIFRTEYENNLLHKNIEKFIPFYNQSQIKKYANILSSNDNFNKNEIVSIIPMKDKNIITSFKNKNDVNRIMIHFKDGSVSYYTLELLGDFNSFLPEYKVKELDIIYTPNAFVENNQEVVNSLAQEFKSLDTNSLDFAKKIYLANNNTTSDDAINKVKELYLSDTFLEVKDNIEDILKDILVSDKMINLSSNTISEIQINKIRENKEYILTGLSYLKKWYPIKFGEVNIGELVINYQNFFGKNVETIDFLIDIGKSGFEELKVSKSLAMYDRSLSINSNYNNLFSYLEEMKNKFTNYEDMNTWVKRDTNIYIAETDIGPNDTIKSNFYEQMTKNNSLYNSYFLPLLTAKEGIFTMVTPGSIAFGMYDSYMDIGLKENNFEKYMSEKKRVESLIARQLKHQKEHLNFWYNILPEGHKDKLMKDNPIWDGYRSNKGGWLTKENANQAMKDFFLPVGKYFKHNGLGAYSDFKEIYFVINGILEDYGSALYAHEMMHNNDANVYFLGKGRRNGLFEEYYALGMIQPSHTAVHNAFTLNTIFDFTKDRDLDLRTQNIDPKRINTDEKLQDYMKKTFDVIYTLDYAEAEVMLSKNFEEKKKWYTQMTTTEEFNHDRMLPLNVRVELPEGIELNSIEDLIDNEIVSKHGYKAGSKDIFNYASTNGYYYAYLFRPIYGSGESNVGTAGDIMFRRIAFELLAYKGYQNGMLPYLSNILKDEAKKLGENKVKDSLVISKVSDGKYNTIKDFKKEMFKERYEKKDRLKSVTINYKGTKYNLNGYDDIKELLNTVITEDLKSNSTNYEEVKNRIFTAYLNLTNDFEQEIYN